MNLQRLLILLALPVLISLTGCSSSGEPEDIPEYKPQQDRLKFSIPPYETPLGTVFTYEDKFARKVSLAGDFNNWNPLITPLKQNKFGVWEALVPLRRGVYTYKYNVDGQWIADPKNFRKSAGPSGDLRSVMTVTNGMEGYFRTVAEGYTTAFPPTARPRGIEFSFADLNARAVSLGGTFNNWSKTSLEMRMNRNGIWTVTVPLEKGKHPYKFCVDGEWRTDPENPATQSDGLGDLLSIVDVTEDFPDEMTAPHPVDRVPVKLKFLSRTLPSRIKISVVGDWNGWEEGRDLLTDPEQDKTWEGVIMVRPGRYLYRFKIRNEEFPDPRFDSVETAPDGQPATRLEIFIPAGRTMIRFAYRPFSEDPGEPVRLAGDFNNWDLENDAMEWDPHEKAWFRVLDLPKGKYRYQFRIGNRIEIDQANPRRVADSNGVIYSVVVVP
jgi:1,4-alpha-glucan branching enzyme